MPKTTARYVADEGIVDGVQYVTVLDEGYNPIEYEVPEDVARLTYGVSLATHPYDEL